MLVRNYILKMQPHSLLKKYEEGENLLVKVVLILLCKKLYNL